MNIKTIGFIGGGRITRIFLEGWNRANKLPAKITVSDPNPECLAKLKARFPSIMTTSNNRVTAAAGIVFLAVHPPVLADTVAAIKDVLKPDALVVSLAPKYTFAKLTGLLGGFARLARVIPNAPSVVGAGFNPVAFGTALTTEDKAELRNLLAPLGDCPEVAEEKLQTYALFTARGPTYFWCQFYELCRFAEASGLTKKEAQLGLEAMLIGALKTMITSGLGREEVMDLIPVNAPAELETQATEVFGKQLPSILEQMKS